MYRAGEGFTFESDQDAIREAQDALDQLEYDNQIAGYDKTIAGFNTQKENETLAIDTKNKIMARIS